MLACGKVGYTQTGDKVMGWTTTHVPKGKAGEYLNSIFTCENENTKWEMIKGAFVGWHEHYAAVRITKKDTGLSYVIAVATKIHYYPHDYHNFGYKDMDESMGPFLYNCPESILKLLTPSAELLKMGHSIHCSASWRAFCWEKVLEKKDTNSLKDGAIIQFESPLLFNNGDKVQTFQLKKRGKAMRWYAYDLVNKVASTYAYYKLRKRDLGRFTIVNA